MVLFVRQGTREYQYSPYPCPVTLPPKPHPHTPARLAKPAKALPALHEEYIVAPPSPSHQLMRMAAQAQACGAFMCACVRACVRACACASMCVSVCVRVRAQRACVGERVWRRTSSRAKVSSAGVGRCHEISSASSGRMHCHASHGRASPASAGHAEGGAERISVTYTPVAESSADRSSVCAFL